MTRVDWIVLRRVMGRIAIVTAIFISLFALVETLNAGKMAVLGKLGGPLLQLLDVVLSGLWASIGALPVTVLIGTVAGIIDLQMRRELTVAMASGISIWRLVRAPLVCVFIIASAISLGGETGIIDVNRTLLTQPASKPTVTWLEQQSSAGNYIIRAGSVTAVPPALYDVEAYMAQSPDRNRIEADSATLGDGQWTLKNATIYKVDGPPQTVASYALPTQMTLGDLRLTASGVSDLTLPELLAAASTNVTQADARNSTMTALFRSFTRPFGVIGSMLIAIASAAGYRRTVKYANTVLAAIVIGFVLFVVNELAIRAGSSGVLAPVLATGGPALVSIIVGATALLYSQDGYT